MPMHRQAVAWYAALCGTRPLRPPASLLHNAALPSVSASQSQAPFVSGTASRPIGLRQQALCKVAFAGVGRTAVGAPRSLCSALRAASWLPCGGCGAVALVRHFTQCSGQWPAASHVVCPAHPCGPRRCAAFGPALGARPPPRGSHHPSARGHICAYVCLLSTI